MELRAAVVEDEELSRSRIVGCLRRFGQEHGVTVLEIPSGELSRGRGGPRCMSMPLIRGDLND